MTLSHMADAQTADDAHLVELGRDGNRDAFGQLVARYQSSICALAYCACGDISQSEDLAQETFLVAWRKLRELKEPAKFRSWLYGIARNLINSAFRQQTRNPLTGAESLDESIATLATVSNPAGQAISKEEEGILWRSLEQIPEAYREPLVLFYREQQSVERVAITLEVSEDVVRQRLSRGRKLLHERVIAFVEGTLERTAPGRAFTLNVLSALPPITMIASSSSLGSTLLKGGAAGKAATTAGGFAVLTGLLSKFLPAVTGTWLILKLSESSRERKFACKAYGAVWAGAILYPLLLALGIRMGQSYWEKHPQALTATLLSSAFVFVAILIPYTFWLAKTQNRIRKEEAKLSPNPRAPSLSQPYEYRSRLTFLGLPLLHIRFHCEANGKMLPAIGWVAMGNRAYGILLATGTIAVGGISSGACAIGLVALGGTGIGLFAFGGLAVGVAAIGGAAIGYLALGGGAIGWQGASGGAVWARHYAQGGRALAEHANDQAAWDFMQHNLFFQHAWTVFDILIVFSWLVPPLLTLYFKRRRQRTLSAAKTT